MFVAIMHCQRWPKDESSKCHSYLVRAELPESFARQQGIQCTESSRFLLSTTEIFIFPFFFKFERQGGGAGSGE